MKTIKKSDRLGNVHYELRGPLAEEAYRMEQNGETILKLNIGNPYSFGFTAPDAQLNKLGENARNSQGYSESHGIDSAIEAILRYAEQKGIPNVTATDIYTGNGASELIQISLDALLNPGDEILIPTPDYPLWTAAATFSGGKVVHYLCDEQSSWYPDLDDIESKITYKTKAIVIINPNNPTGAIYPREILEKIVDIARRHDLIIFSDEIYDRLVLDGEKATSIASLAPDVFCITMNGLSKSHMLCGYRIGWMVLSGNKEGASDYIDGINMLTNMRLCSNVPGQQIIASALSGKQRAEEYFLPGGRIYEQNRIVCDKISDIPGLSVVNPKAAFYAFPKLDIKRFNITDDSLFAMDFLKQKKVLIIPGSGFNWQMPDHFRIVCLPDASVMADAMDRLGDFLEDYHQ